MPKRSDPVRRMLVEQRRSQILTAALDVFARKGFERATIADIAREAGMAEGSIYNYFKNKSDLLVSLPQQIIRPNVDALDAYLLSPDAPGALPPVQVLAMFVRTILGVIRQNAPILRILLSALPAMKPAARNKYFETVRYAVGHLQTYLRLLMAQGVLRADLDPEMAALGLIGMFFPYIMLHDVFEIHAGIEFDDDALVNMLLSVFLDGARARPDAGAPTPEGTLE
ncbi:MAG: TetR/AcrR family transcriptional regulator [Anaerolineae bacterium]